VEVSPVAGDLLDRMAKGVAEIEEGSPAFGRQFALIGFDDSRLDRAAAADDPGEDRVFDREGACSRSLNMPRRRAARP